MDSEVKQLFAMFSVDDFKTLHTHTIPKSLKQGFQII